MTIHAHGSRPMPTLGHERDLAERGYDLIVGFDEVGRGALAGPVMVGASAIAAAGITTRLVPAGVADSKLLTAHQRESIVDELRDWCTAYAVGQATNVEIDEWGISHALGIAALRALNQIEIKLGATLPNSGQGSTAGPNRFGSNPDRSVSDSGRSITGTGQSVCCGPGLTRHAGMVRIGAILDGPNDYITKALNTFDAPSVPVVADVFTMVKADQQCATVATASVIAKVTRDRLMVDIAQGNPAYRPYHWSHNKGYGSAEHRAAIVRYGATDLHRRSWHLI